MSNSDRSDRDGQLERVGDDSQAPSPRGGRPVDKVEKWGWSELTEPGAFMMVPLYDLHIDRSYQRDATGTQRLVEIAKDFDWFRFGTLRVVLRPDGRFVVADGQHRALAAAKRSDVSEVPCMVWEWDSLSREAQAFVDAQMLRKQPTPFERHRAALVAKDPVAMEAEKVVQKHGYRFTQTTGSPATIKSVTTVHRMVKRDSAMADAVIRLAVDIANGDQVQQVVLQGLEWIALRDNSLFDDVHRDRLVECGQAAIVARIKQHRLVVNKGGSTVYAQAIVQLLNKGRRTNKIDVHGLG